MTDEEIRALWHTMTAGWARGDAARFASVFAADVDFVNVRGEALSGRDAVESGHAQLFATAYRGTTLSASVTLIRRTHLICPWCTRRRRSRPTAS